MEIKHLNHTLYTDLPIDELEERMVMEELEDRLELACWASMQSIPAVVVYGVLRKLLRCLLLTSLNG